MSEQVVQPRIRGFIATNSHPEGCRANVRAQMDVVRREPASDTHKNVLVVGASTGYGLAARVTAAFGYGADTLGVFYERPPNPNVNGIATAGYYNSVAFHDAARDAGLKARSLNGDAFALDMKERVVDLLREEFGPVDLLIYSLASPRRTHPTTGIVHNSTLKPIGEPFTSKTIDLTTGKVTQVTIQPAVDDDVGGTIAVMGGEDFAMWTDALIDADLLAEGASAVAFSYVGPRLTHSIYRSGTIGKAKEHLEATARGLNARLDRALGGRAYVSVNKAVVTNASAAIPIVPLYLSILYPVMREAGTHEAPIQQAVRLFRDHLRLGIDPQLDEEGRIRLDDRELRTEIQAEVDRRWELVTADNVDELADFKGFRREFRGLFGFEIEGVDYAAPTETDLALA